MGVWIIWRIFSNNFKQIGRNDGSWRCGDRNRGSFCASLHAKSSGRGVANSAAHHMMNIILIDIEFTLV
jgi:hypothetical protein